MSFTERINAPEIQYVGEPGMSQPCLDAVTRLLQHGDRLLEADLLSCHSTHCLILRTDSHEVIAVKSGFASGYRGEGSRSFSYCLALLNAFEVELDEYDVSRELIVRLDHSRLTERDLNAVATAHPVRPTRWRDYLFREHWDLHKTPQLPSLFAPVIPFSIVDPRILDLAIAFWDAPGDKLLTGYRRLEDVVRTRTGIEEHGSKLFSNAFQQSNGKLCWHDVDGGERAGRVALFTGVYQAYRNPRAHRELYTCPQNYLSEFLLLNQLFALEAMACLNTVERPL